MRAGLAGVILVLALAGQPSPPHHWADDSAETRQLAQHELDRLMHEGDKNSGRAAPVFKNARLDDPFYYYGCDATFAEFAADTSSDLMPYLVSRELMFPIVSGSDAIGVLRIRVIENSPVCYFIPVPAEIYDRFKNAIQRVRLGRDERLSVLSTGMMLDFFIVEDGTTITRMAPCTPRTLLTLGLNDQHVEDMHFVPAKEMIPLIKRAMTASR
jgi:hypothetical protein